MREVSRYRQNQNFGPW